MPKVFLSHSSKDKEWYVDIVYHRLVKALGENSVIIDRVSFEQGRDIVKEIYHNLSVTDLFVVFLSEYSLESPWVLSELDEIKKIFDEKKVHQFCPIIIDEKINYDDSRIPSWLSTSCNIKKIFSQAKSADVIRQRMIEISYLKHPGLKERDLLFVGRNDFLKGFEERIDDLQKQPPVVAIASGLEGVGRRTFLRHGLIKSNVVKESYPFSYITLGHDESIEDCILKVHALGFTKQEIKLESLSQLELADKIGVFIDMIIELQENKIILFMIDNGCIINHEGKMVEWFKESITSGRIQPKMTFLLVCKFRYYYNSFNEYSTYYIALPELDTKERNGLLKRYLEMVGVELDYEKNNVISNLLNGLPDQVFYAVSMIKDHGWNFFIDNSHDVVEYGNRKAVIMLKDFKNDPDKKQLLVLLSKFDYISPSYIMSIAINKEKCMENILDFYNRGLCEYLGVSNEYIRVNDAIKNYLQRSEFKLSDEYEKRIREKASEIVHNIDDNDYDIPELLHSLKSELLNNNKIKEEYIIPSIYLKTMNDLYNSGKNKEVIQFADKALLSEGLMDKRIVFEIRYLLCAALAKLRNDRFKSEVTKITGADHEFLFGFYYRQIGKFDSALEKINKSLDIRENFSKARREKVQIFIGMQDYESALELSGFNYENYPDNPYHIQAYFTCVIKADFTENRKALLKELIEKMENIGSNLSKELTLRFRAQYAAFVELNYEEAIGYVNRAIEMNDNIHYARLVKFEISEKFSKIDDMKEIVAYFKNSDLKQRYFDNIVCMESLIKAKEGDISAAIAYFKFNVKNYTDEAKDRFVARLNKYAT